MTTFVLVHGGWHGGWCWRRVAPLLKAAGHEVHTPTLTGLGERAHLAGPDTGLATHVEDVVARLEMEDLRDVVLVGHSSGGAVITGVAQRAAERLAALVYLFLAAVDGNDRIALDWDAAMDSWAVRAPADRAWLRPRLRPHPLGALADPLLPTPVPDLPRHYVHCTDKPGGDSFTRFAAAAQQGQAWRLDVLDTGHDARMCCKNSE